MRLNGNDRFPHCVCFTSCISGAVIVKPYAAVILWAIIVDAVAISLWLWVISGVYLWVRRPNKRKLGTVCVVMGCALFVALVTWLCV